MSFTRHDIAVGCLIFALGAILFEPARNINWSLFWNVWLMLALSISIRNNRRLQSYQTCACQGKKDASGWQPIV